MNALLHIGEILKIQMESVENVSVVATLMKTMKMLATREPVSALDVFTTLTAFIARNVETFITEVLTIDLAPLVHVIVTEQWTVNV